MPQVSVIVPVYKVGEYLSSCVESILAQSFSDFELILVDDGSPDDCPRLCDEWAEKDSRITVIHKENGGVSSARNAGLEQARGEYIAFVDADDWLAPSFLEKGMAACREGALDMFMAGSIQYTAAEEQADFVIPHALRGDTHDISGEDMCILLEKSYGSSCWGKLIKKEFIGDLRFDTAMAFGEDLKFVFALLDKGGSFLAVPEALYYYRCNPESATKSTNPNKVTDLVQVYQKMFSFGKERVYSQEYLEFVGDCWAGTRGYFRSLVSQSPVNAWEKWKMYLRIDSDPMLREYLSQCKAERVHVLGRHPIRRLLQGVCLKGKVLIFRLLKKWAGRDETPGE